MSGRIGIGKLRVAKHVIYILEWSLLFPLYKLTSVFGLLLGFWYLHHAVIADAQERGQENYEGEYRGHLPRRLCFYITYGA